VSRYPESRCGLSRRELVSRRGLVPAVPTGHREAMIIPGDLTVRNLRAHGCTSSGSRPGSDEGLLVHYLWVRLAEGASSSG
jgi:hypothetical protein